MHWTWAQRPFNGRAQERKTEKLNPKWNLLRLFSPHKMRRAHVDEKMFVFAVHQ